LSNCSNVNTVRGTGAWILRNSWGDSSYPYVYLAYDSLQDDVYVFTDVSSMSNRNWDNNYHKTLDSFRIYYGTGDTQYFVKNINTQEKLEKVKFFSFGRNGSFKISINTNTQSYTDVKTVTVEYPGIYTIDLSDKNILLDGNEFAVTIQSTNGVNIVTKSMSAFTSNVDEAPVIQSTTSRIDLNKLTSNYSSRIYSYTKNVPSGSNITYRLYNSDDINVSSYISVSNRGVAKNDVNASLIIYSSIPVGLYKLKLSYGSAVEEIPVVIGKNLSFDIQYFANGGAGTMSKQTVSAFSDAQLNNNTFTKIGYLFHEWNTKEDGSGTAYSNQATIPGISSNLNLFAQWSPITYIVKFHANGAEKEMEDQEFTYDVSKKLKKNSFEYEGYLFSTWNTKEDGSGKNYSDEEEILNLASVQDEVIDLYAIWIEKPTTTYEIHDYSIDEEKHTLDWIEVGTSLKSYQEHFDLGEGYRIEIDLGSKSVIYTGSVVKIYYQGSLVNTYTNIVRGDVNGDGIVNSADLLKIVRHLKNLSSLQSINWKAADCNDDDKINSSDLLKIVKFLKGTGTIQKKRG
jgi:hypothetical protein